MLVTWKTSDKTSLTPWQDIKYHLSILFKGGKYVWYHPSLPISFSRSYDALYSDKERIYHKTLLNRHALNYKEESIFEGILHNPSVAPLYINTTFSPVVAWALSYDSKIWDQE